MKVIHFLNELKFSGAEIMYVDAAPVFQKLGCDLFVVNTARQLGEYTPSFKDAGYKIIHKFIPNTLGAQWKMRKELIRMIKDGGYDVVHIHRSDLRWILSYCAWKAGCKSVYTAHNVFRSHWYSYPLHYFYRWTAKHIFNCKFQSISDSVYNNELNYYHIRTILVYNWYGKNRFSPAKDGEKDMCRKKLNIDKDALVVISVGGCSGVKRHEDVLYAMTEIVKRYPKAVYLHLGEGTALDNEKAVAKKLGIEQNVRFCGNIKEVREYLIASDIYVMPSKFEGISITTIEAMACRIPAVLYNVPGLRDFNKETECSVLIAEDFHLLAKSVMELYEDKNRQKQLTDNAETFVNGKFDMDKNVKKIYDLYRL